MSDIDDKAKEMWDKTKEKADKIGDKSKAEYHEKHGEMKGKMDQADKQER